MNGYLQLYTSSPYYGGDLYGTNAGFATANTIYTINQGDGGGNLHLLPDPDHTNSGTDYDPPEHDIVAVDPTTASQTIVNNQEPAGSRDLIPTSDDATYNNMATTFGSYLHTPPNQDDPNYGYYSPHDPINLGSQDNYAEGGGLNSDWINVPTGIAPVFGDPNSVYVGDQQGPLDYISLVPGTFNEDDPNLGGIIWKVDVSRGNPSSGVETPIIVGGSTFSRTQDLKVDQNGNIIVLAFDNFTTHDAPELLVYQPIVANGNTTYTLVGSDMLGSAYNGVDVVAVSASPQTGNDVFYVAGIGANIYEIDATAEGNTANSWTFSAPQQVWNGSTHSTDGVTSLATIGGMTVYQDPPLNYVNFEPGNFSQTATHTNGAIVTSLALDGSYSLQLQRNNGVANAEIRAGGSNYYNLGTAFYSFKFEEASQTGEGGVVNFQDTSSGYKAALHLSSTGHLLFYDINGHLVATGNTQLQANKVYTISAAIGTGSNAPWEVLVNGNDEMSSAQSGDANLGTHANGSIEFGGNNAYTTNYFYDDVAINAGSFAPVSGLVNAVNFEGGSSDWSQVMSHTGATIDSSPDHVLDGAYSVKLQRNNSVANVVVGAGGTHTANLATAYYSFQFEYTSDTGEGGIANFQDTSGAWKAALHLSSTGQVIFYPSSFSGNLTHAVTSTMTLQPGEVYSITAMIGTGTNAAWEIWINGIPLMSSSTYGTANLGTLNNGSIDLGGNSNYTGTFYYDDIAISSVPM